MLLPKFDFKLRTSYSTPPLILDPTAAFLFPFLPKSQLTGFQGLFQEFALVSHLYSFESGPDTECTIDSVYALIQDTYS